MMDSKQSISFVKCASAMIAGLTFIGLSLPVALADTKAEVKEIVAAMPADADFKKLDVNSDGKISLKESVKDKSLAVGFDMTDSNKDGNITAEEYASYKAATDMKPMDVPATVN